MFNKNDREEVVWGKKRLVGQESFTDERQKINQREKNFRDVTTWKHCPQQTKESFVLWKSDYLSLQWEPEAVTITKERREI